MWWKADRSAVSSVTVAPGSFEEKGHGHPACEVISLIHQGLLHSIVSHQDHRALPAQVQGHHRPVGFTELKHT